MLSKQICKKCISESFSKWDEWDEVDDKKWDGGWLRCSSSFCRIKFMMQTRISPVYSWELLRTKDSPPDDCLYLVEQFLHHSVTGKTNEVQKNL